MTSTFVSSRQLRASQIFLAIVAGGTLLFPWISYPVVGMHSTHWESELGIRTAVGSCLATFLLGSLITSGLEALLKRRAVFVHAGFFFATLIIAIFSHLLPFLPGVGDMKLGLAFESYILCASVVFAVTGMLSPTNKKISEQAGHGDGE